MSDATKAALDAAIEAHAAACGATLTTGYVLLISCVDDVDLGTANAGYLFEHPDRQPYHVSVGLGVVCDEKIADEYGDVEDED